MGDASDFADLQRFMASPEGQAKLSAVRQQLEGKRITSVCFSADALYIRLKLLFEDSSSVSCMMLELSLFAIRDEYGDVLDREYHAHHASRIHATGEERIH